MSNQMVENASKPSKEHLEMLKGTNVLSADQYSKEELMVIMETAAYYEKALVEGRKLKDMKGKIMASLFFEPSTRTRLSFEAAMQRLGGSVVTVAESQSNQISSTAKGESLADTIRVVDSYVDVTVMRSPIKGAVNEGAQVAKNPIINAGNGADQHPTQALLDIYTIFKEKGRVEGLTIGLLGDLKYGRTVHSLVDFLALFGCSLVFISPKELAMPAEITEKMRKQGIEVEETTELSEAAKKLDVLYVTRIQRERFINPKTYQKIKGIYIVDDKLVESSKEMMIIMHPLPRINEINVEVDKYPGAAYFRQAKNGVPIRMALLALTTGSVL